MVVLKDHSQKKTSVFVFLNTYFVIIATIIGVGILGFPVQLADSGLVPFSVVITITSIVQSLVIFYFTELLVKTQILMARERAKVLTEEHPADAEDGQALVKANGTVVELEVWKHDAEGGAQAEVSSRERENVSEVEVVHQERSESSREGVRSNGYAPADSDLAKPFASNEDLNSDEAEPEEILFPIDQPLPVPGLQSLAQHWLNGPLRALMDATVLTCMMGLMCAYVLAGSQGMAGVVGFESPAWIVVFWGVGTGLVVFLGVQVQYLVGAMTSVKGVFLTLVIALTGIVSVDVQQGSSNSWAAIGQPFLISCVAMGGICFTLAVAYSQVSPNVRDIKRFVVAAQLGYLTCYILDVAWCIFVLGIVPQESPDGSAASLSAARKAGQISTVPLVKIISQVAPQYKVITHFIQWFIFISISVSYLIFGAGLRQYIDNHSAAKYDSYAPIICRYLKLTEPPRKWVLLIMRASAYTAAFGVIVVTAALMPQGFFKILDIAISFLMNFSVGLMIVVMYAANRWNRSYGFTTTWEGFEKDYPKWAVYRAPRITHGMWPSVLAFYIFAVLYDMIAKVILGEIFHIGPAAS